MTSGRRRRTAQFRAADGWSTHGPLHRTRLQCGSSTSCGALKDGAKAICIEEAKAQDETPRAELEYNDTGNPADAIKARFGRT